MAETAILERGPIAVPTIVGRGRKHGGGCNGRLLLKLKPGDAISELSLNKMKSLRCTAHRLKRDGFMGAIKIRRMPPPFQAKYFIFLK